MALVPVLGVSDVLSGALQSLKRIVGAYLPDQVLAPLGFLGVVALMHFVLDDLDAIHMLAAMLAAQLFSVLLQSGWLRTALPADYLQAQPAYKVGKWLKTAMPVLFMTMFGIIVYRADLLIVGLLLGRTQAGIYAAVLTTAELIGLFLSAGRAVASPRIAPLQKHGDTAGLQRLMTLLARYAFVPSLLAFIVVVVFGHQALALFGTGFDAGYNALIVLAASQVAKAAFGGPAILLLLTGRQVVVAKVYLVAMVLDVAAQLVLIPWLGLIGAATASLLTVVIAQSVQTVIAARRMGIYTSIFGPLAERA
jgi:O-antigen/teichoic acid export membrane protein